MVFASHQGKTPATQTDPQNISFNTIPVDYKIQASHHHIRRLAASLPTYNYDATLIALLNVQLK